MPFILTWDEANPVNATAAANIDDEIRASRAAVGERMVGMFSDWRTATDRVHASKFFVDAAGLLFRDQNDTQTLATLTQAGRFITLLGRASCFLFANTGPGGGGGNVVFNTELIDTDGFHDVVTNNTRITIPAGLNGNYFVFGGCLGSMTQSVGVNSLQLAIRKNNTTLTEIPAETYAVGGAANNVTVIMPIHRFAILNLAVADYLELNINKVNDSATNFFLGLFKLD